MLKVLLIATVITLTTLLATLVSAGQASPPAKQKQILELNPKSIPVQNSVVMGNKAGSKKLYIFTDPDCPGCRKQHTELKKLVQSSPELTIHVLFLPLPLHPFAYDKTRIMLASKDAALLDTAFTGGKLAETTSDEDGKEALEATIKYAAANRITKTPTVIMPDGKTLVGVITAERLKLLLDGK